jgi:hypothetical protein
MVSRQGRKYRAAAERRRLGREENIVQAPNDGVSAGNKNKLQI